MDNIIARDVFLAFIRVHILHHSAEGPIFGVEMMDELREHGYSISPGTLYPILHSLEKAGYLRSRKEIESGKVRKYYRATTRGRKVLSDVKTKIKELVDEVLKD